MVGAIERSGAELVAYADTHAELGAEYACTDALAAGILECDTSVVAAADDAHENARANAGRPPAAAAAATSTERTTSWHPLHRGLRSGRHLQPLPIWAEAASDTAE